MQVKIPHQFTKDVAKQRVKDALERAAPELAGKATVGELRWEGDTLHFAFEAEGQAISGTLGVEEGHFDLYAKLPLMMKLFEGRLEKMILEQSQKMLG